ncbi:hypothetical protein [uncultured Rikenella sp.]|uniref:hypothetical protein n=1 Tax=uncultured Rikenella sp. TaxID=368003 RepID=UPI00260F8F6D|nr:hypothetical protein [uncultured Rikenella sp.]
MHSPLAANSTNPAPGFRGGSEGALGNVSRHGFNWSSTTGDIGALDVDFSVTYLYPSNTGYRAGGRQLRCLSE